MRKVVASIPSRDDHIQFLRDLQRLLEEGSFTATYKFALVHAIADLAVLRGNSTSFILRMDHRSATIASPGSRETPEKLAASEGQVIQRRARSTGGGRVPPEWQAGLPGIRGRFAPDSVAGLLRNTQS
jgi:hypothetical protein